MDITDDELQRFEALLQKLDSEVGVTDLTVPAAMLLEFDAFDIRPSEALIRVLHKLRIHSLAPLHLAVIWEISTSPDALRRLSGRPFVDDYLLELLGFRRMRDCLTDAFFQTFYRTSEQEEPIWWAAESLEQALKARRLEARPINSIHELLCAGELATANLEL